ncbi:MAG: hypothetical protein IPJ69_10825 [Deltaproteobacteria bacterium]|nr:MAG: hypothetical protein IPJ69_10825 [Deltaproteobacteria bacterium]
MSAPVFGTNVTRLSLLTTALNWTVTTLKEETSPDYFQATYFLNSCLSALRPEDARRFAENSPIIQAEQLLSDQDAKMYLGMQISTLLDGAQLMTDTVWARTVEASPALQIPQLYTDPKRQHKAEAALAKGGTLLYPAGVLGAALNLFCQNGDQDTFSPDQVGQSTAAFSNPEFGDTAQGREDLMAGKIPGLKEKGINVNFPHDDRYHPVAIPSRHRNHFAQHAGDVILAPVAQGLENCLPIEMALAIKSASPSTDTTRLVSAVKGLNASGMTALEYIEKTLQAVPDQPGAKKVSVIDVLGYIPVAVLMQQMQEYKKSGAWRGDPLNLVLACPDYKESLKLAKRWCRVGVDDHATVITETRNGVEYTVVENKKMIPPMRIVLLTDPVAIKANELASIYKNLMGLKLGRELFNETVRCVEDASHPMYSTQLINRGIIEQAAQEEERKRYLEEFYKKIEKIAEREIYQAINLDLGIKNAKQLILDEVRNDMYGSWSVTDFNRVYKLTHDVFSPELTKEKREEGIVKFKFNVGAAFTVRNIQYGFTWAADEAALSRNFSIKKTRAEELCQQLKSAGTIPNIAAITLPKNGGFFFFSLIPDKLTAEGVSIAENLRKRYKKRFKDLPDGIKEASNFVQRIHHESFLGDDARTTLLDISKDMARALLPVESLQDKAIESSQKIVTDFIERISGALDKSEAHLVNHLHGVAGSPLYERARLGSQIIDGFRKNLFSIRDRIKSAAKADHQYYANVMQELIEIMALSNRIDIVPPSAVLRQTLEISDKLSSIPPAPKDISTATAPLADRSLLANIIMPPMTELVFEMSQKLHSPTAVIQNRYLTNILSDWEKYLQTAEPIILNMDTFNELKPFLADLKVIIKKVKKALDQTPTPQARGYALQALIELVIYARRLFVVNTQEELTATLRGIQKRFDQISKFLDTNKANADTRPATPFMHFQRLREAA